MSKLGRLTLRTEDKLLVAYYARPDTMDGAIVLGSIGTRFVQDEARKTAFIALMRAAVNEFFEEEMLGLWPEGPHAASEYNIYRND
jgi:hypothetical protein